MSKISRRKFVTAGLAATAGVSGLAVAARLARRYGLIPPDSGGIYGPGETLTYAAQRLLTRHSLAREFPRSMISKAPFANEIAPLNDAFKRLQAGGFADWRLSVDGMVARPGIVFAVRPQELSRPQPDHRSSVRRGLVLYRRVDRNASGRGPERLRASAAGSIYRLLLDRTRLVGEHRHGRCSASPDSAGLGDERRRSSGRRSAVRCGCACPANSATRASNSSPV